MLRVLSEAEKHREPEFVVKLHCFSVKFELSLKNCQKLVSFSQLLVILERFLYFTQYRLKNSAIGQQNQVP